MELEYGFKEFGFTYEVSVKVEDIFEYLTNSYGETILPKDAKEYFRFGVDRVFEQEWIDYDKLQEDKYFYEFMLNKYHDKAYEEYKRIYEDE